jgi:hypothetical protein
MTNHQRISDAYVRKIGEGFLNGTLPLEEWTHQAHCLATLHLMIQHPQVDASLSMPELIVSYNQTVGKRNSDATGFHATITEFYVRSIRKFLRQAHFCRSPGALATELMASPWSNMHLPMRFYSEERLFSVEAKRRWVKPDLRPLNFDFSFISPGHIAA